MILRPVSFFLFNLFIHLNFINLKVPDPSPPPTVLAAAQPIPATTNRIGGVSLVAVTNPTLLVNGVHPAPTAASSSPSPSSGKADACVGTCSASTMTEPDCLGPCEPGTAVTLEGIVWHETEGGLCYSFFKNDLLYEI